MNIIKSYFICIGVALAAISSSGKASELISFEVVIDQYNKNKDESRVTYLFCRCAALQLNVVALLKKGGNENIIISYENSAKQYMTMAMTIEEATDKKRGVKDSDPSRSVSNSVKIIADLYNSKMVLNYAKKGEYLIGDLQLERELAECRNSDEFIKKIINK